MEFNWSIVGWIAGLAFVYLFGLFEGRGQGYKRRKAEEEQESTAQPPPPAPKPETIAVEDPGLMRIKKEKLNVRDKMMEIESILYPDAIA